jgi:hypothetical protein
MTTFTTNLLLPKPSGTDAVDVVKDVGALADTIDSTVYPKVPYIARQTLGGAAATVTFSSIPSALRSLRLRWTARGDAVVQVEFIFLRVNNDSGNNYNAEYTQVNNTTVSGAPTVAISGGTSGYLLGASAPAGAFGSGTIDFVGWDSPHSGYLGWTFNSAALGTGAANFIGLVGGGQYVPAGPYTSVTLFPNAGNFVAGSDFQLEGWPT